MLRKRPTWCSSRGKPAPDGDWLIYPTRLHAGMARSGGPAVASQRDGDFSLIWIASRLADQALAIRKLSQLIRPLGLFGIACTALVCPVPDSAGFAFHRIDRQLVSGRLVGSVVTSLTPPPSSQLHEAPPHPAYSRKPKSACRRPTARIGGRDSSGQKSGTAAWVRWTESCRLW
jgi:hypothetical protein